MYKIKIDATDRYRKTVELVNVIGSEEMQLAAVTGDIDIVATIRDILEDKGITIEDIGEFESNPGPGSFTGLKIGSSIANVLNWALGRKSIKELTFPDYGREPNISPRKK
ncbi:MAG: hypothetical protein UU77_C0042G0005 [candidate division WWE3 bacterium GW2011_GWC1_41_7]|uniref:Gcp-like domain-containing protein n=1 Tax=candidate division WWE3 bacterium GW2011_GWC1_41_7 TaxID=1619119 RepID=A0A0G0ZC72_UNCKA|nr:MAG: hypothetical protein UU77_C0042G0005 [candidate division WWE3 bacterium GW2011_GWC1_41_7]